MQQGSKRTVTVHIDRPLGSRHPEYPETVYPVNYGFVRGMTAPDGEEQDAYVLGVNEAAEEFTGELIAVIHREDDVEDKWVVAPPGASFTAGEIMSLVSFQEKYFNTQLTAL